jgi:hypothetical protein
MGFFKPKPPVDLEEFEWLMACLAWLNGKLAAADAKAGFTPMLARPDTPGLAEADGASSLFAAIKDIAGMGEWECILEQGLPAGEPARLSPYGEFSERGALGTFLIEGNSPVIRYDPALLRNPEALTATLAHELAHLISHSLGDPPGGEDLHEHATDCAAVYLGFGVFLANSARRFEQFQDAWSHGWQSSTAGYLSERALVTLTAMFVRLFGIPAEHAADPLKPYLKVDFAKALKYIDWRYPDFPTALQKVELDGWA